MLRKRSGGVRDGLALAHALPDRSLIVMVAAMSLLASLTLAGAFGATLLSSRWAAGAANLLTVQVPEPDRPCCTKSTNPAQTESRLDAVMGQLGKLPQISSLHRLSNEELGQLLAPWLGTDNASALPLPAVIEVHLKPDASFPADLEKSIDAEAPGSFIEKNDEWRGRLASIASSLLACAALALGLVGLTAAAVIGMATRLGLGARRNSVMILHGLGASDGYVASRFGRRVASLSFAGGVLGTLAALLPIAAVSRLVMPFTQNTGVMTGFSDLWAIIPQNLLIALGAIPLAGCLIGWSTAQIIVRLWLRRLP